MKFEKCPVCGGPLEAGKLHSRGSNFYLPDGQKMPAWYSAHSLQKKQAIPLPPDPYGCDLPWKMTWPVTYVCRTCKFLLIPYEEYE